MSSREVWKRVREAGESDDGVQERLAARRKKLEDLKRANAGLQLAKVSD